MAANGSALDKPTSGAPARSAKGSGSLNCASDQYPFDATTTNGSVTLHFVNPPESIDAGSTNGAVTVQVPIEGVTYRVDANTTNGHVDDDTVPTNSTSRRSITAHTTNGTITIQPAP